MCPYGNSAAVNAVESPNPDGRLCWLAGGSGFAVSFPFPFLMIRFSVSFFRTPFGFWLLSLFVLTATTSCSQDQQARVKEGMQAALPDALTKHVGAQPTDTVRSLLRRVGVLKASANLDSVDPKREEQTAGDQKD